MTDLLFTVVFFLLAIAVHAYCCRFKPQGVLYAKDFVIIALCLLAVEGYFLYHLPHGDFWFPLSAIVIYILLIPTFLIVYVSMVLMSPSKRILQLLSQEQSVDEQDLLLKFNGDELIVLRLDELIASQCVVLRNDKYQLTFQGEIVFHGLMAYQQLSGREGEG